MTFKTDTHHSNMYMFLTVRIAGTTSAGDKISGTGFFYDVIGRERAENVDGLLLVTNKHVIDDVVSGELMLHLHADDNPDLPAGKSIPLRISDFQKYWIMHPDPDVDLCAAPIGQMLSDGGVDQSLLWNTYISPLTLPTESELELLPAIENVIMVGYPIGIWDHVNNLPVVRKGITATHPAVDYQGKARGLVDIATFAGSSGSPLIVYNDGLILNANHPSTNARSKAMLLGVISCQMAYDVYGEITYMNIPTKQVPVPVTSLAVHLGLYCKARDVSELAIHAATSLGMPLA